MRPSIEKMTRMPGVELGYQIFNRHSSKVPLVMITGLSAAGTVDWDPLDEALGASRPVLVMDNRMIGSSTVDKDKRDDALDFELSDLADDVVEIVKHLGWKTIDLLGFSMGGMIAQHLVLKPDLPFSVKHLILTGTSAKNPKSSLINAMKPPTKPAHEMTEADLDALIRPFMEINYSPSFLADASNKELFERRVKNGYTQRRPFVAMMAQSQAVGRYNVMKDLVRLPKTMPVLIIHGQDDKAVWFSERARLLDCIKHAEVAKLPHDRYGHFWYDYFDTETWVNVISEFLDRPASPSAKL